MTRAATGNQPQSPGRLAGVKHTVAVGAGKGGVGKSTAAALLAVGLTRRGHSVGLLDADIYGPSIPTLMGVAGDRPDVDEARQKMIPVESLGVKVISIGFMIDPSDAVVWRGPMVHGAVQQFLHQVDWGELDYLIVDLPPGTGDVPLSLSQQIPLTGSVVVCTPQDLALADARRAIRMYERLNVATLGIIENMSYYLCPKCGHREDIFDSGGAEQAAGAMNVPFLGAIPLNASIRRFCDAGTPDKNFTEGDEPVREALDGIVGALVDQVRAKDESGTGSPTISFE